MWCKFPQGQVIKYYCSKCPPNNFHENMDSKDQNYSTSRGGQDYSSFVLRTRPLPGGSKGNICYQKMNQVGSMQSHCVNNSYKISPAQCTESSKLSILSCILSPELYIFENWNKSFNLKIFLPWQLPAPQTQQSTKRSDVWSRPSSSQNLY